MYKHVLIQIVYFSSCVQKDNPVDCGQGRYSKSGHMSCEPCPVGTYCPLLRTESPWPCSKGFYSINNGSSKCIECERGKIIESEFSSKIFPAILFSVINTTHVEHHVYTLFLQKISFDGFFLKGNGNINFSFLI